MRRTQQADFAGVALVDILANGVAMLIIVIVLSIAARADRERESAEKAAEVATVLSHKFSTSLVLNNLGASPPAVLHDYQNSELDRILDPQILPILELHREYVREFYTGAIWPRAELLRERSAMSHWAAQLSPQQKQALRIDIYEISEFYIATSILREYGIKSRHWHFLPESLPLASARACPPGVAARDCIGLLSDVPPEGADASLRDVFSAWFSGRREGQAGSIPGTGTGAGVAEDVSGVPEGVVPAMAAGEGDGSGMATMRGLLGTGTGGGGGGSSGGQPGAGGRNWAGAHLPPGPSDGGMMRMRVALPEAESAEENARNEEVRQLSSDDPDFLKPLFAALLAYLGILQEQWDNGQSPSRTVDAFRTMYLALLEQPPELNEEQARIVERMADLFRDMRRTGTDDGLNMLHSLSATPGADTVLGLPVNQWLFRVAVVRSPLGLGEEKSAQLPEQGNLQLRIHAYPAIWKGVDISPHRGSALLMPPEQRWPDRLRWRAVSWISSDLEDVVVGFVLSRIGEDGELLVLQADGNRARFAGIPLFTRFPVSDFGSRGWLVSLYALLLGGLLVLMLSRWRLRRGML